MRHGVAGKKFGRNQTLRAATLRDLVKAVLINQTIRTTKVKAGEARKLVDKIITMGKKNTLAAKRRAFALLCDHNLVSDLFNKIAPRFATRQGGYTRIIKLAVNRAGDNAEMVILELTEKVVEPKKTPAVEAKGGKKVEDAVVVDKKAEKKPAVKKPVKKAEEKPEAKAEKVKKASKKA
ncbi:MAG: 50S ribosomal protein L17 [Candidatus Omnitrophica bacterium]|nr:50S ribosomal protein L17 [Candidatus Omnitrophota bacterium]